MTKRSAMRLGLACMIAGMAAAPAWAEELRDFCSDRPGLATPACIVDKGHLQAEIGIGDWTRDKQPDSITTTLDAGDIALRYGITDTTELRFDWTAFTHVRTKDRMTGAIDHMSGVGDVQLGLKQSLLNPAGDKLSIAILPFGTIPTGSNGIGAGTWSAGIILPVNYAFSDKLTLEVTPEVDAAPNEDGSGRHLAYLGIVGLQGKLTEKISLTTEIEAIRDHDPDQHMTQLLGAVSVAYQPGRNSQFDLQTNIGLNHNAPDVEVMFGVSGRF